MFKLHVLLLEDIQRRFRVKKLIFPSILFVLIPIVFLLFTLVIQLIFVPFIGQLYSFFTVSYAITTIQQMHIILSFYLVGTIIGPLYAIIQGGSTFSPQVKNGTIKMIVSKPVGRTEIYLSKLFEYTIPAFMFSFLSLLVQDLFISLVYGGSLYPLLYLFHEMLFIWFFISLIQMLIYAIMTALNALTFSTVFCIIFGLIYFIAWPLVFSTFGMTIPMIFISSPQLDNNLIILILNIIYGSNPTYYPYSLLSNWYLISYGMENPLATSMLSMFFPLYPTNIQDSIGILMALFLIPTALGCLRMTRKNFHD